MWFEMCFFTICLSLYIFASISHIYTYISKYIHISTYISISGKIMGYIFRNKVRNRSLAKSIKSHYIHEIQEINHL